MDYRMEVINLCDSIEEKIYDINSTLRDKGENEELTIEITSLIKTVKSIKENVNDENAYNVRSELISIQSEVEKIYENINKK